MKIATLLISLLLVSASCTRENVLTEGAKTAQQVQDVVSSNNIQTVDVYLDNSLYASVARFRIEGQFLVLLNGLTPNRYLNLSELNRFEVNQGVNPTRTFIAFYF